MSLKLGGQASLRSLRRRLLPFSAGLLLLALCACWILPARAYFSPGGSYYTFGVVSDEPFYAERLEPLIDGCTPSNVYNGLGDPTVVSQHFFEDGLRGLVSLLRIDAVTLIWVWRLLFPLLLALAFVPVCRECLPRGRSPWGKGMSVLAATAALPLLYALYNLAGNDAQPHLYLERIPTNSEFIASVLLAWAWLRCWRTPTARHALLLGVFSAAMVYVRLYAALPWGICIALTTLVLLFRRRLAVKNAALLAGVFFLLLAPWIAVLRWNGQSQAYQEMLLRYFGPAQPYSVHPRWVAFLAAGALLALAGKFSSRYRAPLFCAAATSALLPFICAPLKIARELLWYDRFVSFYMIVLIVAALAALGDWSRRLRGRAFGLGAKRAALGLGLAAVFAALQLAWTNSHSRLDHFDDLAEDSRYLPAYAWIRAHTPEDALFVVDEGFDWESIRDSEAALRAEMQHYLMHNDLFLIAARRRRLYVENLYGTPLSDAELERVGVLHRGTFGFPVKKSDYVEALKIYWPAYIFWRKTAPIPRGFGRVLEEWRTVVYQDRYCEIWKLAYPGQLFQGEHGALVSREN